MKEEIKRLIFLVIICCFSFAVFSETVAAQKVSDKKIDKAYEKFLAKKENKYKWFKVLDVGIKKEPVLLVAENVLSVGGTYGSRMPGYTIGGKLFYYTGSKVKAVKGGNISTNDTGLLLTRKRGGIFVANHWGLGTLVKVKNGKTVGKAVLITYENGNPQYYKASMKAGEYYNKRKTTKAVYNKYEKKWAPKSDYNENGISKNVIYLERNSEMNRKN